jgi:hypothetical protein
MANINYNWNKLSAFGELEQQHTETKDCSLWRSTFIHHGKICLSEMVSFCAILKSGQNEEVGSSSNASSMCWEVLDSNLNQANDWLRFLVVFLSPAGENSREGALN